MPCVAPSTRSQSRTFAGWPQHRSTSSSARIRCDPTRTSGSGPTYHHVPNRPQAWGFCLHAFSSSTDDQVKFWCLQTLVDLVKRGHAKSEPLSSPDEQTTFRTALIAWVQAQGAPTREEAPFVKNKFAQLVVAVIARDYPQMWPHAFTQLLDVLQCGPGSIDMFLRVLNAVHEEVICSDGGGYNPHLASKIKDAMREQCLPQITDAWFSILQLHESAPGLVVSCLNTMHLYVNWMDIALLSHPRFVGLLLPFMRQPQLHDGACLCLGEIVLKRMEAPAKLQHIERLELVGALSEAATAVPPAPSSPSHTLPSTVTTQLPSTRTLLLLLHHHHHPSSRRRRAQVTTYASASLSVCRRVCSCPRGLARS